MTTFLVVLHVIACFFLIIVVLLQRGKGAEMGAVFGGGASATVFGGRGAANFLTRLTTISAVVFMCTSLGLSYAFTTSSADRLFQDSAELEAAEQAAQVPLFEEIGVAPPTDAADADGEAAPGGLLEGLEVPKAPDTKQ